MLHWKFWGKEPGVHGASLRRYGSKLVYHITVYFLFAFFTVLIIQYIDTINVPFCLLQQLLKLTATNLNANMTSAYKILSHSDKYLLFWQLILCPFQLYFLVGGLEREALFHSLWGHLTWIPFIISMGISKFTCVWDPSRNPHRISYQNCSCLWYYS